MGEESDLILDGTLCSTCYTLMVDLIVPGEGRLKKAPGYSRMCDDCKRHDDRSYFSPARKLEREREDGWTDEAAETSLKIIFEIAKEREGKEVK